jgi:hypothetical protein
MTTPTPSNPASTTTTTAHRSVVALAPPVLPSERFDSSASTIWTTFASSWPRTTEGYGAGLKPGSAWRPPVVRAYADRASR